MVDLRIKVGHSDQYFIILCFSYIKKWHRPGVLVPHWAFSLVIKLSFHILQEILLYIKASQNKLCFLQKQCISYQGKFVDYELILSRRGITWFK